MLAETDPNSAQQAMSKERSADRDRVAHCGMVRKSGLVKYVDLLVWSDIGVVLIPVGERQTDHSAALPWTTARL